MIEYIVNRKKLSLSIITVRSLLYDHYCTISTVPIRTVPISVILTSHELKGRALSPISIGV